MHNRTRSPAGPTGIGARPGSPSPGGGASPSERLRSLSAYDRLAPGRFRQRLGLDSEEFVPGESFVHAPGRSFFAESAARAARSALELAPAYHDLDWIGCPAGGTQVVNEPFVIGAVTDGADTRTFAPVVANLGWHDVVLPVPVCVGDKIAAESTVLEAHTSRSRPGARGSCRWPPRHATSTGRRCCATGGRCWSTGATQRPHPARTG